jgi:hypothetical protein
MSGSTTVFVRPSNMTGPPTMQVAASESRADKLIFEVWQHLK